MTAVEHDDTTETLMTTALHLAEQTPDLMAESIAQLEEQLIPLYEAAHARGDTGLTTAIDGLWAQVQHIHALATSQALGVASTGIVAVAYKIQRDEALVELGRVTEAYKQVMTLVSKS